ncbi:MAG: transketolase C-terminal domain-containing protein [Vicinamibacteria bacterium]
MQIRNELALIRWRSNGSFSCPVVIRVTYGYLLEGGAVYHSQCGEVIFTHVPGLRVVIPSNAEDAGGLLRTAIRGDDPVLFLEHKHLYRQTYNEAATPARTTRSRSAGPRACARAPRHDRGVRRPRPALARRRAAGADGIEAEILDLRTLSPYDWDAIAAVASEDGPGDRRPRGRPLLGLRRGIAARVASDLFEHLDAPVRRVAALDTFVGYTRASRTRSCRGGRPRRRDPRGRPLLASGSGRLATPCRLRGEHLGRQLPAQEGLDLRPVGQEQAAGHVASPLRAHRAQGRLHARDGRERGRLAYAEADEEDRLERLASHLAADGERPAARLRRRRHLPQRAAPPGAAARRGRTPTGPCGRPPAGTG